MGGRAGGAGYEVFPINPLSVARYRERGAFDIRGEVRHRRRAPGLGVILAAHGELAAYFGRQILGEFGDDPHRYSDAKARKNYAATSPITIAADSAATLGRTAAPWTPRFRFTVTPILPIEESNAIGGEAVAFRDSIDRRKGHDGWRSTGRRAGPRFCPTLS